MANVLDTGTFFKNFTAALRSPDVMALENFMGGNGKILASLLQVEVQARRVVRSVLENGTSFSAIIFASWCPVPFIKFYPHVKEELKKHAQFPQTLSFVNTFSNAPSAAWGDRATILANTAAILEAQDMLLKSFLGLDTGAAITRREENGRPSAFAPVSSIREMRAGIMALEHALRYG